VAKVLQETCAEQSISGPVGMFWAIVKQSKSEWRSKAANSKRKQNRTMWINKAKKGKNGEGQKTT